MTVLSEEDRLVAVLNIGNLAISAENAALNRRFAQSDFNTVHSETGKKPSRRKVSKLEAIERDAHTALRKSIYDHAERLAADKARAAGIPPLKSGTRAKTAQMLADHLP